MSPRAGRSAGEHPPRARMAVPTVRSTSATQGHQGRRPASAHGARVPEFDWLSTACASGVEEATTLAPSRRSPCSVGHRAVASDLVEGTSTNGSIAARRRPDLDPVLTSHWPPSLLRHSPDRVGLLPERFVQEDKRRPAHAPTRHDGDLRLGARALQAPDPARGIGPVYGPRNERRNHDQRHGWCCSWNLRQMMAAHGLFQTSDLVPLLEERQST